MSHNHSKLYYHAVFSTKHRARLIPKEADEEIAKYIGGVLRNLKCSLLAFGAFDDHVHLLFTTLPHVSPSEAIGKVKANSSRWLASKQTVGQPFSWQQGFAAFTVSQARLKQAMKYVNSQRQRHRTVSFAEELAEFFKAHGIEPEEG